MLFFIKIIHQISIYFNFLSSISRLIYAKIITMTFLVKILVKKIENVFG